MRTIAHDLGEKFGCGGHLNELRRTAIGQFRIDNAAKIEELEVMSPSTLRKQLIPRDSSRAHSCALERGTQY